MPITTTKHPPREGFTHVTGTAPTLAELCAEIATIDPATVGFSIQIAAPASHLSEWTFSFVAKDAPDDRD